jgi:hypothetical protein
MRYLRKHREMVDLAEKLPPPLEKENGEKQEK